LVEAFAQSAISLPVNGIAVPPARDIQQHQQIPILHFIDQSHSGCAERDLVAIDRAPQCLGVEGQLRGQPGQPTSAQGHHVEM
jgi:hypothetical protein